METEAMQQPENVSSREVGDAGVAGLETVFADLERRLDALVEARLDVVEARWREAEREALLARFSADNPDFRELAASGALEAEKLANPLLDDVGAYFAHRLATEREAGATALAKAREEAAAQAEADTVARFRTKRLARTVGAAPSGPDRGQGVEPDLAAPEKFGGMTTVLAARLAARRQSAGL